MALSKRDFPQILQAVFDENNQALRVEGNITVTAASIGPNGDPAPIDSTQVGGTGPDGNLHPISTDNSGNQNVNVISSALPTGAATAANQATQETTLSTIATNTTGASTAAKQDTGNTSLGTIATNTTGVATAANQTTGNTSLSTIATNSGTQATAANQSTGNASLATIATNTTNAGTPVVSGTVTANQGTPGVGAWPVIAVQPTGSNLHVQVDASALPTGAATSANQSTEIASLATIATNSGTQATAANQTTGNTSLSTIATNSSATQGTVAAGTAATKADLVAGVFNTSLPTLTTGQQAAIQVDSSGRQIMGTSAATIGTINIAAAQTLANVTTVSTVTTVGAVTAITNALPTGTNTLGSIKITDGTTVTTIKAASTAAVAADTAQVVALSPNNNTLANALFTKTTDGTNTAAVKAASTAAVAADPAFVVAISPNNSVSTTVKGTVIGNAPVQNIYSTTSVTTGAYVPLVASTTNVINTIHIFDSSGQAMILATGAAASEVNQLYIAPGGDTYTITIPAGTRLSYKALSANATSGYVIMSFLQ